MTGPAHTIGVVRLLVDVASEDLGRSLLPRVDDLQKKRIAPIIERVLDELSTPGERASLGRVSIDLGTVPLAHLEEEVEERLRRELRRALGDALRAAREGRSPDARIRAEAESRLELLEHILLHGALPLRAPEAVPRALEAFLMQCLEQDPESVARLLRRHRGRRAVLERIVLQLSDEALARLLRELDPENAALILAYLLDLGELHRVEPVVALGERAYRRALWVLVLHYVLRDPGTQFNRRSFVLSLVAGLAESEGVAIEDVLEALRRGLRQTESHRPLSSSLPAVLDEILKEADRQTGEGGAGLETEEQTGQEGAGLEIDELLRAIEADPDLAARLFRKHVRDRRAVEGLVDKLGEDALRRLLRALDPESAALIIAYLVEVREVHRVRPLVALAEAAFGRLLWVLTLSYVLHDPGTQFNRKAFVSSLLEGLSISEGIEVPRLVSELRAGLTAMERRRPVESSLPAVLDELISDMERAGRATMAAWPDRAPPGEAWSEAARTERGSPVESGRRAAWGAGGTADDAGRGTDRREEGSADEAARATGWKEKGSADEAPLPQRILQALETDMELVAALVLRHGRDRRALERLVRELPEEALEGVLRALSPAHARLILDVMTDIRDTHREAPVVPAGEADFASQVWILTLSHVIRDAGSQFNRKSYLRSLLEGLSASNGVKLADLVRALRAAVDRTRARRPLDAAFPAILGELVLDLEREGEIEPEIWPLEHATASSAIESLPEEALFEALPSMLEEPTEETLAFLAARMRDERVRERWSAGLTETTLRAAAAALAPRRAAALIEAAELLYSAWVSAAAAARIPLPGRPLFWSAVLDILSRNTAGALSIERWTVELLQAFAAWPRPLAPAGPGAPALMQSFLAGAASLADNAGNATLGAALSKARTLIDAGKRAAPMRRATPGQDGAGGVGAARGGAVERSPKTAGRSEQPSRAGRGEQPSRAGRIARTESRPIRGKTAFSLFNPDLPDDAGGEAVLIDNAGLALTGPFLPHLFQRLDLLGRDDKGAPRMRDHEAASRAVHLLQWLVCARTDAPEPLLVLNKILCGVPAGAAVAKEIEITDAERSTCEQLLRSMIAHWTIISNTSIAGLRETFLQREGKLTRADDRWILRVQRRTVDVLVDQIPWSISVIVHPFMPVPLYVTW